MYNAFLSTLAIGGLAARLSTGVSLKTHANSFCDLKTLYASAWCFFRGANAYSLPNLQSVLARQGVVQPADWFGHYAVYPPTTLALLAPFSLLSITHAIYTITFISILTFIAATTSLLQHSEYLTWPWKAVLVTLCASCPLLGFALIVGNLSVLAAGLSILAFTVSSARRVWFAASLLALAILVKPHVGIWIAVGMLLLRQKSRHNVAGRAAAIVVGFIGCLLLAMRSGFAMQTSNFLSAFRSETSAGSSMNIFSREVLPVEAQITSLPSLLAFWTNNEWLIWISTVAILGLAFWWLMQATLRAKNEEEAILAVGAWIAFGLLATYHRTHDAIVLLLLLPLLLKFIRNNLGAWRAWAIIACYLATSFGPSMEVVRHQLTILPLRSIVAFILLRQAAIAGALLFLAIGVALRKQIFQHVRQAESVNLSSQTAST